MPELLRCTLGSVGRCWRPRCGTRRRPRPVEEPAAPTGPGPEVPGPVAPPPPWVRLVGCTDLSAAEGASCGLQRAGQRGRGWSGPGSGARTEARGAGTPAAVPFAPRVAWRRSWDLRVQQSWDGAPRPPGGGTDQGRHRLLAQGLPGAQCPRSVFLLFVAQKLLIRPSVVRGSDCGPYTPAGACLQFAPLGGWGVTRSAPPAGALRDFWCGEPRGGAPHVPLGRGLGAAPR